MRKTNIVNYDFGNGDNVFLTSDLHFYHERIISLCNRPFDSVEEMNEKLIENWNSVVGKNDIVFNLGDFCWGGTTKWNSILERLNGHQYLILGNHDEKNLKDNSRQYFEHITYQMSIHIDGWKLYMNHYPFLCFGGAWSPERFVAQAFGHTHFYPGSTGMDCKRLQYLFPSQYDVGVDNNNYTPISWKSFKDIVEKQMYNGINMYGEAQCN